MCSAPGAETFSAGEAQQLLAAQARGSDVISSPAVLKDFLRARLGSLPHEVFAGVHLDAQNRVLDCVEMFRSTVSQTSVYPSEVLIDVLHWVVPGYPQRGLHCLQKRVRQYSM